MKLQVTKNSVFRWFKRVFLYGTGLLIAFVLISFIVLQIPSVQKKIINRYLSGFIQASGFTVQYDDIYLTWYDRLQVHGLIIKDPEGNTMVQAGNLEVNFGLSTLLQNKNINIDGVLLEQAGVNIIKITEADSTRNFNINVFINQINKLAGSGTGKGTPPKVNIGEVVIHDTGFTLHDAQKDSIKDGFDYNHITLAIDEVEAQNFKVIGDTIEFNMNTLLAMEENAKLKIENVSTFFRVSQTAMEFLGLEARAGKSFISDTLVFKYNKLADLNDFNNKVRIRATFRKTVIDPSDLILFAPNSKLPPAPIFLEGKLTGRISRFTYQDMEASLGNTYIKGKLEMDGLPSINETFINFDIKESSIDIRDLRFLFADNVYNRLKPLEKFRLQGKFTGFVDDFVANGNFRGGFGEIKSDINVKLDQQYIDRSTYSGNLALTNFDLGTYFQDTVTFQRITLTGRVKGRGLTRETADFHLAGKVSSVGIRHYDFKNIVTDARFAKQLFNGVLSIEDPNLQFHAEGSVNFRPGEEVVKVTATLDTLVADKIGLMKDPFFISSYVDVDTRGLDLDSVLGTAVLRNTFIQYKMEALQLDSIYLISELDGNTRHLRVRSSYADADLKGNFYYTSLFSDIERLVREFKMNVRNNKEELAVYYATKDRPTREYDANFTIRLNDINPLIKLANMDLTLSANTVIEGKFSSGYTSAIQAFTAIDTVTYQGKSFYKNEIDFSGSKIRDSTTVLAMLTVTSAAQEVSRAFKTRDLFTEAIWDKDHIDLNIDFDQQGTTNLVRLRSEIDFLMDSVRIKILPSRIMALEKEWKINQKNYTLIKGNEISIHNLEMFHQDESIRLHGPISYAPDSVLSLTLTNLNLNILNAISSSEFNGIVNGSVEASDLYKDPFLQNNLFIKDLTIDKFLMGDVNGTTAWNRTEKRFEINFAIDRLGKRTLNLEGFYQPDKQSPMDVTANLEKTNIKIIEPFLKGIFSQMDGTLSGTYKVTGTFSEPQVSGSGKIEEGKIMIDYLKTLYSFNGTLGMTPTRIIFEDFVLTDALKNKGTLDGYLTHRNYRTFRIDLDAAFTGLQVLNTTSKDNNLFYGQAYASGNLNMLGPLSNMKISATARTAKNTRIFIPISGTESVERSDFVTFVNFRDSAFINSNDLKKRSSFQPSGITMDLNLDITPDAYAEIIFDIKSGDIIRGYGNGDIKLQINTKGEFNMFGLYEFERGNYNFTLYDIINKEFSITKGSRISWYGDPYEGMLNLTATYRQLASLGPILPNQQDATVLNSPQIRRKYPVEVLLKLEGPMLSPQINFDIAANNLPENVTIENGTTVQLNFAFKAFKAKLDEQELKRQVFSLIILRRFSPPDAFNTSGSVYNSVSELLSNQLSYWLTQVDQNLEIDLDLGTLDNEAFNTFQLRLSYSFLNGRLRVTRDGTFSNQYNRSEVATMLGDWTVDYLLTQDGKFKVKMYSRSNLNPVLNSLGNQQAAVTTGVSLLHTQSFNSIKELLRSARERRKKELEQQPLNDEAILEDDDGTD